MESVRRASQETAVAIHANVDACANSVNFAEVVHSAAVEHFADTKVAADQLRDHGSPVPSSTAQSDVKRDTRIAAVTQLDADQAQAIYVRKQP